MELKGSKTESNLMTAFAGESQARKQIHLLCLRCQKRRSTTEIADIFEKETAGNEKEHAKIWFKLLHDGAVPKTEENLKDAAAGERYELEPICTTGFCQDRQRRGL